MEETTAPITPLTPMTQMLASPFISTSHHMSPYSVPLSSKDRTRKSRKRKAKKKRKLKRDKKITAALLDKADDFDASHPRNLTSRQWLCYIAYCWGFFALGIFTAAPGPILPTLMEQVDVSLAIISYIFSARAIGFVIGSMISGVVMEKYKNHLLYDVQGTRYLLRRHQTISDYLWSLPRWSWRPLSSHNVFTISILVAAITNVAIPYVYNVWYLAILVTINGICFGNINTFGNVLLLTLFDIDISRDIDFDLIYGTAGDQTSLKVDAAAADVAVALKDKHVVIPADNDERQELMMDDSDAAAPVASYGTLQRDELAETTMVKLQKQEERVGPFMQFLQAIYALGGLLAPILIQCSFEISGSYAYAFWFFSAMYVPPGIMLLFLPEPLRMSMVSDSLKRVQKQRKRENASRSSLSESEGAITDTDGDIALDEEDPVELVKAGNRRFYTRLLCVAFAVFLLWYVGAQVGYGMYITTYAINWLGTTPAIGRYIASANWAGLFIGRFVAVPLSHLFNAFSMVVIDLIGMMLGCAILFFTRDWVYFVWISSVMVGFCMASVWPCMFVWAESMIPVTGNFASVMVAGGSIGEFVIPAIQGNIMAAFGSYYFNHIMFAMTLLLIINLVVNKIIAKRLQTFLSIT